MRTLTLPGFVDAHCHAFQRAMRGRDRGGDFWAWREAMLALAESLTVADDPTRVRRGLPRAARERLHGRRRVPLPRPRRGARGRRGRRRGRESSSSASTPATCAAASPASARTRSPTTSRELEALRADGHPRSASPPTPCAPARPTRCASSAATPHEHELPLHVHADEQPREIEECLAEHGVRPIELLAREGCLGPRTTVVHATHADGARARPAARRRRAHLRRARRPRRTSATASCRSRASATARSACASAPTRTCASTRSRSCASSRGSRAGRPASAASSRSTRCSRSAPTRAPRRSGSRRGPTRSVDLDHPQLRGVDESGVYEALVFGCSGDVLRKTSDQ